MSALTTAVGCQACRVMLASLTNAALVLASACSGGSSTAGGEAPGHRPTRASASATAPAPSTMTAPSSSPHHSSLAIAGFLGRMCAIRSDDESRVWCWGRSLVAPSEAACADAGRPAMPIEHTVRTLSLVALTQSACALDESGVARCWATEGSPTDPPGSIASPVDVPPLTQITASASSYCGLTSTADVWCWNEDAFRAASEIEAPRRVMTSARAIGGDCALDSRGSVRCWSAPTCIGLTADVGTPLATPGPTSSVASSGTTTCGMMAGGHIWCWGGCEPHDSPRFAVPTEVGALPSATQLTPFADEVCGLDGEGVVRCLSFFDLAERELVAGVGEFAARGLRRAGRLTLVRSTDRTSLRWFGRDSCSGRTVASPGNVVTFTPP